MSGERFFVHLIALTRFRWASDKCVGNVGAIPRLNFPALCMQDSPLGIRFADYVSAFPAGINVAATWDRGLARARGQAMGEEHAAKGVDVQLGPVCGPLGRIPEGGRGWVSSMSSPHLTVANWPQGRLQPRSIPDWSPHRSHNTGYPGRWSDRLHQTLHSQRTGALQASR